MFDAANELMFEKKNKTKVDPDRLVEKDRQRAFQQDHRVRQVLDQCWFCFSSPAYQVRL